MAGAVYPAKAALFARLSGWEAWPDHDPAVLWGEPARGEDFPAGLEAVYLGDPVSLNDQFTTLGAHRLDEQFSLPVVVDVIRPGDDEQCAERRAWELRDAVVAAVRADLTLGGAVNRVTGLLAQPFTDADPRGWRKRVRLDFACAGYEHF